MNGTGEPIDALLAAEEAAAQGRDGAAAAAGGDVASGARRTPVQNIIVQFVSADDGATCGPQIELPITTTVTQMQTLVNKLLENEEAVPYTFYVNNEEIVGRLPATGLSVEKTVDIVYAPQAVFRVRPVTRSTATLTGHTNSVVAVQFSPDGTMLASGSGDATVRLWDLSTQTPLRTLTGHRDWVLCLAWSPDGRYLASGSRDGQVRVWTVATGDCALLGGHRDFVTSLAWEPYAALAVSGRRCAERLASASKDGSVRVWDVAGRTCVVALSGHSQAVQALRWAGSGYIYTGSRDRTVNVYDGTSGRLVRTLRGHGHWVNSMSVSTDFVARTGPYDHTFKDPADEADAIAKAKKRYDEFVEKKMPNGRVNGERLVTGSDDGTLMLWDPLVSNKPLARMTGHQQQVMGVAFSPDGRFVASGSFDKSVKLWDGFTGKFVCTFRGHVAAIYQIAWASDSRMFVSGSKDSTLKLWDIRTKKQVCDLPGHADEVFSVDWSPDGETVASGSFDRTLKLWRH